MSSASSLEALRGRYAAPELVKVGKDDGPLVITVDFPDGPLGMSLENIDTGGVAVGQVAATGVAERGGVATGDRIMSVGGKP